jgi:flagellar basal body-associated protein FliL
MPPTAVGEKLSGSGAPGALKARNAEPLLTPAGTLGLVVVGIVTVILVVRATSAFQAPVAPSPGVHDDYEEVDLGQVTRDMTPEGGGLVRDPFLLKVVVVLNPKVADPAALKQQVERRRNLFRDIIWNEILELKSDADLRRPATLESLRGEIRARLNQELGGLKDGQERILRVIFPERKISERR